MNLRLYAVLSGAGSGRNLVKNWSFVDWTDPTFPDDWSKGGTHDASNFIEESPADSLHYVVAAGNASVRQNNILTAGVTYNYEIVVSAFSSGALRLRDYAQNNTFLTISSTGTFTGIFIATDAGIALIRNVADTDITLASIRIW